MRSLNKKLALLGLAGIGLAHGAMPVSASGPLTRLKPAQGLTLDIGTKRAVAYFLQENGACAATVVLADVVTDTDPVLQSSARVNMTVNAGTTSKIDTIDGPSLAVTCAPGALSMGVQAVDRTAYAASHKLR